MSIPRHQTPFAEWLRDGKAIPAADLDATLDDFETALDAQKGYDVLGDCTLPSFSAGFGLDHQFGKLATSKWKLITASQGEADHFTVNLDPAEFPRSNAQFNEISLDTGATAYGSKFLYLELDFLLDLTAGTADLHAPDYASYSAANAIIVRDSGQDWDNGDSGQLFVCGPDNSLQLSTTAVILKRRILIPNYQQRFAMRIGTGIPLNTASRMGVRVLFGGY